ncbi:sensor histidine kinase [Tenacibaculum crassostreae]|uniref:sensor histidine kinase n=1 Tax=Tenacibaculum crassostreae TaxID=502683 RepID=UPI0038B59555
MKVTYLKIFLHFFLWLLLFIYPMASLTDQYLINRNWLSLASILVAFYLNYFVLVDGFFLKNKKLQFYVLNVLLVVVLYILIGYIIGNTIFHPSFNGEPLREIRSGAMTTVQVILPIILSIGMCVGLKVNAHLNKNKLLLQEVKQTQLNAEIKYLKYQVQPHFLFNTLNNIYALIDTSPIKAKQSIHTMSKMMRYVLHEASNNKVPLVKEIEFLERYIDLMQLRVSSNLRLEKNFPIINQPIKIAPLILITFIENAFKHGIDAIKDSYITIDLEIEKKQLKYSVINSSFPEKEKITDSGIGLENLKKRLAILYPNKFSLITKEENNTYIAQLTLNYKE